MSVRWMAVQYIGNTLMLPIVNADDIDKPVGVTERDVSRIILNPNGDRRVFVPDDENAKLRNLCSMLYSDICDTDEWFKGRGMDSLHAPAYGKIVRELGIEVDDEHIDLQAEWALTEMRNERLVELMADFFNCSRGTGCDKCPHHDACEILDEMYDYGARNEDV